MVSNHIPLGRKHICIPIGLYSIRQIWHDSLGNNWHIFLIVSLILLRLIDILLLLIICNFEKKKKIISRGFRWAKLFRDCWNWIMIVGNQVTIGLLFVIYITINFITIFGLHCLVCWVIWLLCLKYTTQKLELN